jgi:hypothetical protein
MVHAIVFGLYPLLLDRKIKRPVYALQTVCCYIRPILIMQPDWASTSVTDHMFVGNRSYIIHTQASSQAIYMAPVSPAGNTIPFATALTLSSVAVVAAIGQIRGCFLSGKLRP